MSLMRGNEKRPGASCTGARGGRAAKQVTFAIVGSPPFFQINCYKDASNFSTLDIDPVNARIVATGSAAQKYSCSDGASIKDGLATTVSYTKPGGATGTLTFVGGILTGSS